MGPQFAHIQTFSRKKNPAGQSVEQVLGEAGRAPEYSSHVDTPEPPVILYGIDLEALRQRHDQMVEGAATEAKTKKGIRRRSIRVDRHTLMTVVASYPLTHKQIGDDPDELGRLAAWRANNIEHLKQLFGDGLTTVIEHTDEPHPHIHAFALPIDQPGVDAKQLHPGMVARATADAAARAKGAEPRDAVRAGNTAYVAAMRLWQDQYYLAVGAPSGLTRDGPRRARKSGKQWQEEKAAAQVQAELMATLAAQQAQLEAKRRELVQKRWGDRQAARARTAKLNAHEADAKQFRLKAHSVAKKINADRTEVDQDRVAIESEREALAKERREVEKQRARLDARQAGVNRIVKRIREVVCRLAEYLGLPLPKTLGDAVTALEHEIQAQTQELEPEDPDRAAADDPASSFGM
jgi:hypothetical protein